MARRWPTRSNLTSVKLLGRKNDGASDGGHDPADDAGSDSAEPTAEQKAAQAKSTPPKGRPTPKRDESRRRGPVPPAPMTAAEARARRKAVAGPKLSREERKAERAERRARMNERRERMMAGEEAYLLPRDKGPLRRYVRDIVDSRYNLLGMFMPLALVLIFVMLVVPQVQYYISPAMLILMAMMFVDAIVLSRQVRKKVDVKFPDNTEGTFRLGLYAAGRASQMRRLRAPRPMVNRGEKIA
jgi:hypothetical protein